MYIHVCTWYVHGMYTGIPGYKRMFIVQTCMYIFILLCTHFESYKHVHTMYKPVYCLLCSSCSVYKRLQTFHEIMMYRHR